MSPSDSPRPGFSDFTVAELALIQQGLWAIGDQGAVDHRLVPDWRGLLVRLRPAIQAKIAESFDLEGQR